MAVIHVLDKHTAELIAAGEVVERPASVVKELVENAIDAKATRIAVSIERGGVGSITVRDNGTGIEAEYISTAFVRHATSKIATEQDLVAISTLGFRGEALASISAVSRVELLTRTEADEFACLYRQAGGEEISAEAAARPVGTTITVRDLFYNVPARMKFLKKDQTEAGYVSDVVLRQALAHPEISFSFTKDGKEQFFTPGDGRLRSAVNAVLAKDFSRSLMDVSAQDGNLSIKGVVSAPINCRGSRGMQYFFVNGRSVQNTTMTAALEAAYKGVMMQGRFPGCVLDITMPCERVDVNVHPAKTEVRFANPNEIFDLVYRAVKGSISRPGAPARELELPKVQPARPAAVETAAKPAPVAAVQPAPVVNKPVIPPVKPAAPAAPAPQQLLRQTSFAPYATRQAPVERGLDIEKMPEEVFAAPKPAQTPAAAAPAPIKEAAKEAPVSAHSPLVPPVLQKKQPEQPPAQLEMVPPSEETALRLRYIGEAFNTYLICEQDSELVLIDKHAAHERILYEKLAASYGTQTCGQMLLSPVEVNLTAGQKAALTDEAELLEKAGFEVDDFGGNTVVVRSVPAEAVDADVAALLEEIAQRMCSNPRDTMSEKTDWLLHSVACRAAIKAGDKDRPEALVHLARDILSGKVPPFCPHGRPVLLKLPKKELEKQFGRLG